MRRLAALALGTSVLLVAAPAAAQSSAGASGPSDMLLLMAAVGAAVAVFLLIIILLGKTRSSSGVQQRLGSLGNASASKGVFGRFAFLRRAARSAESAAAQRGATNMIESALEQANIPLKPGEAIITAILVALLAFILLSAITRSFIWGVIGATLVLVGSLVFVNQVAARTRKRFETQLPDTLNLLATSLRAGYSLLQAVEAVGQEAPEPTRREFGRAMAEIRLGRPINDALSDIAERMDSQDFEWTVMAIGIQREVGGNLAEVLQTTSETMVQRNRLRREMKALTAEGRISAYVLAALPLLLFGAITVINPDYLKPMLENTIGLVVMGAGIVFIGIGIYWMSRIVKVDA
ncbi:MAG: type II secretion system F family protein [Acidimicrobiia bacterium]|nr:type II secretion system F family protein [Acidimicrobiia bacterium]